VRSIDVKFSLPLENLSLLALVYVLSLDVMVDGSDVLALEGFSLAIVVYYLSIFP
jgi:hypothetical protein